jgi:hypothetical protein
MTGVSSSAGEVVSGGERWCDTTCYRRSSRIGTSSPCMSGTTTPTDSPAKHPRACKKALPPCAGNQDKPTIAVPSGPPAATSALSGQAFDANPKLNRSAQDRLEAATPAVRGVGSSRLKSSFQIADVLRRSTRLHTPLRAGASLGSGPERASLVAIC